MKFWTAEPYQFVPSEKKAMMSALPTVAVIVGAVLAGHLTLVNVAVVAVPEAGCRTIRIKDLPAVAVGIVTVRAVADVSVKFWNVPLARFNVTVEVTVPML